MLDLACVLTCVITTTGSDAVVRYECVNRSQEPVFVAHIATDAAFKLYPGSAYTALSLDGRRINLVLGDSPLPLDREVEYGASALFVKVPPGEQVSGEIKLPVPVHEWNAYDLPDKKVAAEFVTAGEIVLGVDIIPQDKATRIQAAKTPPGHWQVSGERVRLTCSLTLETPIAVRKRRDNFPRS
jgi:hypothetical protein